MKNRASGDAVFKPMESLCRRAAIRRRLTGKKIHAGKEGGELLTEIGSTAERLFRGQTFERWLLNRVSDEWLQNGLR
jgi:hypothetical protein